MRNIHKMKKKNTDIKPLTISINYKTYAECKWSPYIQNLMVESKSFDFRSVVCTWKRSYLDTEPVRNYHVLVSRLFDIDTLKHLKRIHGCTSSLSLFLYQHERNKTYRIPAFRKPLCFVNLAYFAFVLIIRKLSKTFRYIFYRQKARVWINLWLQ